MAFYGPLPKRLHPDFIQPGQPPVGPVEIDQANPITRGLVELYLGASVLNLVDGREDVYSLNSNWRMAIDRPTRGEADNGRGIIRADFSDYPISNGAQFSILYHGMFCNRQAWSFRLGAGGATYALDLYNGSANFSGFGFAITPLGGAYAVGDHMKICFAHDGPYVEDSRGCANGVLNAGSGSSAEDFNAGGPFRWNDSVNGYKDMSPTGAANLRAIWDRALSDDEMQALDRDPYQLVKPAVGLAAYFPASASSLYIGASAAASLRLGASTPAAAYVGPTKVFAPTL